MINKMKEYFWNQGKAALLLDGEERSGPDGALAKWLTDSDRQAYNTYMSSTKVSSSLQKIGSLAPGIRSAFSNIQIFKEGYKHLGLTKEGIKYIGIEVANMIDGGLNAKSVYKDIEWAGNELITAISKDPNIHLETLVKQYMEDDTILLNYEKVDKDALIQASATVVCAYLLGGYAGAAETILGTLKSTMIGFTFNTYTDFFNYVAWVSLQYGYSGRYALRFSDYAGI